MPIKKASIKDVRKTKTRTAYNTEHAAKIGLALDVARKSDCAPEKVSPRLALMHSWNLRKAVLMGTGRIPAQAAAQAARFGIPVPASRNATTAQGIAFAEKTGSTVIAFVRGGHMSVCSHAKRMVP